MVGGWPRGVPCLVFLNSLFKQSESHQRANYWKNVSVHHRRDQNVVLSFMTATVRRSQWVWPFTARGRVYPYRCWHPQWRSRPLWSWRLWSGLSQRPASAWAASQSSEGLHARILRAWGVPAASLSPWDEAENLAWCRRRPGCTAKRCVMFSVHSWFWKGKRGFHHDLARTVFLPSLSAYWSRLCESMAKWLHIWEGLADKNIGCPMQWSKCIPPKFICWNSIANAHRLGLEGGAQTSGISALIKVAGRTSFASCAMWKCNRKVSNMRQKASLHQT